MPSTDHIVNRIIRREHCIHPSSNRTLIVPSTVTIQTGLATAFAAIMDVTFFLCLPVSVLSANFLFRRLRGRFQNTSLWDSSDILTWQNLLINSQQLSVGLFPLQVVSIFDRCKYVLALILLYRYSNALMSSLNARGGWRTSTVNLPTNVLFNDDSDINAPTLSAFDASRHVSISVFASRWSSTPRADPHTPPFLPVNRASTHFHLYRLLCTKDITCYIYCSCVSNGTWAWCGIRNICDEGGGDSWGHLCPWNTMTIAFVRSDPEFRSLIILLVHGQ